jgi:hypothetical protein
VTGIKSPRSIDDVTENDKLADDEIRLIVLRMQPEGGRPIRLNSKSLNPNQNPTSD